MFIQEIVIENMGFPLNKLVLKIVDNVDDNIIKDHTAELRYSQKHDKKIYKKYIKTTVKNNSTKSTFDPTSEQI